MKITGTIWVIEDSVTVRDFQRRKFVLEKSERGYTQYLTFELFQSHCEILDSFKKGDKVAVEFNLNGRKWIDKEGQDKYFNTLQAWKVVLDSKAEVKEIEECVDCVL
jgi:single-stranded DNA-binding protein